MYHDPLSSTTSIFATQEESPWQTASHSAHNTDRASTSTILPDDDGPSPGLYGKEPKIYGQPEPGLISPGDTVGSNGTKFEKMEPYLRVRLTGLDRNRRDILVRFDAQTNLSNFTGTTYRNVSRSYLEFQQFYDSIIHSNPQTVVPALPLPQTSAPTDEEDDRLVKIMLQRWFTRVCEDPILLGDEDVRSFIESDFGYQPTPRPRRKGSAGFSIIRRGIPDEDEELQRARFELTKLEGQFFETAKAIDRLAVTRKSLAAAHIEMGNKLINVATTEAHPPLGNALRKLGRAWHSLADLGHAQAISECVVIGDSLGYQGMNARSAKETLLMRTGVLEEYQAAVKTTTSKRRQIERLKASNNIRQERVDDAIEEMDEASKYEQVLARRAEGISQNLHRALDTHNRSAHDDITTALIEHARSSIMYERQLLRELEALRVDVANATAKVLPVAVAPRPTVIPPLENFSERAPLPSLRQSDQPRRNPPPNPQQHPQLNLPSQGPLLPNATITSQGPSSLGPQPSSQRQEPLLTASYRDPLSAQPSSAPSPIEGPSPSMRAGSECSAGLPDEPPLGGRFFDGSKSMFVKPTQPPPTLPPVISASTSLAPDSQKKDPLQSDPLSKPFIPVACDPSRGTNGQTLHAPSSIRQQSLSSSVHIQPTRPRLDPKEAASKLANMF